MQKLAFYRVKIEKYNQSSFLEKKIRTIRTFWPPCGTEKNAFFSFDNTMMIEISNFVEL